MTEHTDFAAIATKAGWVELPNGDWLRPAGHFEPANETTEIEGFFPRRAISVTSAEEACDWDDLTE